MQGDLFNEPTPTPALSQWFTPDWLARRVVEWLPRNVRILEPSCGKGVFIRALLRAGHPAHMLSAIDVDQRMVDYVHQEFERRVAVVCGDFLELDILPGHYDVVVGNFPFENNLHLAFTLKALSIAPKVAGVFPSAFEFSQQRDAELWRTKGVVRRRAFLPERVVYGGQSSGMFDSVALSISRRMQLRRAGEPREVSEETWLEDDQAQLEHFAEVP